MADVAGLLALPTRMLSLGNLHALVSLINSVVNWIGSKLGSTTVSGEAPDVMAQLEKNPEMAKEMASQVEKQLASIVAKSPDVPASLKALLSVATSALWTAFECLCSDVWVACVNSRPREVIDSVLSQLVVRGDRDDVGLTGKQISVKLLAKHHFDLRACMGEILKEKFDFSSVQGAQKAFEVTFPVSLRVSDIFCNQTLRILEQTRNVIVHRAGIVDEEYVRRTKIAKPVGQSLAVEPSMVEDFGVAVQESGIMLLQGIDCWLARFPRPVP